jgi:hypothetical protein
MDHRNLRVSAAFGQRCGVVTQALDIGATVTDAHVDVPLGLLAEDEFVEFKNALPLLEDWVSAEHVPTWFAERARRDPAQLRQEIAHAQRAAAFLDCKDFLNQVAKLCLFYLRAAGAAGFLQLSASGAWPGASVQFNPQVTFA